MIRGRYEIGERAWTGIAEGVGEKDMTGMATYAMAMIEGVELLELTTHLDNDGGFFREILKDSSESFTGFGQWSYSKMVRTGKIKAWHIHEKQTDYWYVPIGVVRAVVAIIEKPDVNSIEHHNMPSGISHIVRKYEEFLLGENQPAQVLKIPPGIAHGLKVLQGPAHLFYITDKEYDPDDEGRIAYDALGYDWLKEEIR